jgi:hypothetical protein
MAKTLLDLRNLHVTSYCGPADTSEPTRMRLQIGDLLEGTEDITIGYTEAVELHRVLGEWLKDARS